MFSILKFIPYQVWNFMNNWLHFFQIQTFIFMMVSPSIFLTQSITIINCLTSWATFHSWAIKISSCFSGWSGFGFHTKITNCGQCLITDNVYKGFTSKDFLAYLVNHIEKSSRRKLWNYWTEQSVEHRKGKQQLTEFRTMLFAFYRVLFLYSLQHSGLKSEKNATFFHIQTRIVLLVLNSP